MELADKPRAEMRSDRLFDDKAKLLATLNYLLAANPKLIGRMIAEAVLKDIKEGK